MGNKLIAGYDLSNEYAQISVASSRDGTVETLSQVAGQESYLIPAVLCKRYGTNQWFYGREALRLAEDDQGVLVENLLTMALDGEPVIVDGESFDPAALLALFLKRSLGNLKIGSLMITCPFMDDRAVEVLGQAMGIIQLKADRLCFQGYGESFYSYMLRQPEELWLHHSVLFDYKNDFIMAYHLECNRKTRPMVVSVETKEYAFYPSRLSEGERYGEEEQERDEAFRRIAEEVCGREPVGSVYLIGEGFSESWMKSSLRFLCGGRRVFQGNNLFSKGACCGMQERLEPCEAGKSHVYLGKDKLKANVGMEILRRGEASYYALLDAGVNWYEAEHTAELYLQEGKELTLLITPLIASAGGGGRTVKMLLEGLPEPPARIRLHLFLESEDRMTAEVQDLGFGNFRAPSGMTWRECVELYAQ